MMLCYRGLSEWATAKPNGLANTFSIAHITPHPKEAKTG